MIFIYFYAPKIAPKFFPHLQNGGEQKALSDGRKFIAGFLFNTGNLYKHGTSSVKGELNFLELH